MRTVHEIEALRPSDPVPKSMTQLPSGKSVSKLKLIMKTSQNREETPLAQPPLTTNGAVKEQDPSIHLATTYPPELGITDAEEALGPQQLFRLLRRQVHWAEQNSDELKKEVTLLEEIRRREFVEKEILIDAAIQLDLAHTARRRAVLAGTADIPSAALKAAADKEINRTISPRPSEAAPMENGDAQQLTAGDDERAAAVLASLHQV